MVMMVMMVMIISLMKAVRTPRFSSGCVGVEIGGKRD